MKRFLFFVFLVCLFFIVYTHRDDIVNFIIKDYIDRDNVVFGDANSYYKDYDYGFVQNTTSLFPKNRQDVLNIIYTTLNRGLDNVTFYCDYDECLSEVNDIAENSLYLSTINNLVHPYNSYSNISFEMNNSGKVHINVSRIYSDSSIFMVNDRIKEITDSIITDDMSTYDKILAFHDYIVDHTVYDSSVSINNQLSSGTNSNNAVGLLFEGKAICSGYSDVMAVFLNMYGVNNYKISSDEHIWNLVNIDGEWKHIDVTWDDPITSNGANILLHDFFLISTDDLFIKESSFDKDNHQFDKNLYLEAM